MLRVGTELPECLPLCPAPPLAVAFPWGLSLRVLPPFAHPSTVGSSGCWVFAELPVEGGGPSFGVWVPLLSAFSGWWGFPGDPSLLPVAATAPSVSARSRTTRSDTVSGSARTFLNCQICPSERPGTREGRFGPRISEVLF